MMEEEAEEEIIEIIIKDNKTDHKQVQIIIGAQLQQT
jgi:hypothetical protein